MNTMTITENNQRIRKPHQANPGITTRPEVLMSAHQRTLATMIHTSQAANSPSVTILRGGTRTGWVILAAHSLMTMTSILMLETVVLEQKMYLLVKTFPQTMKYTQNAMEKVFLLVTTLIKDLKLLKTKLFTMEYA